MVRVLIYEEAEKEAGNRATLQQEFHSFLALLSLGLDLNDVPMTRFLPLRVYISEANSKLIENISKAIEKFSLALGFVISDTFPPEKGSWFERWFAKSKEVLTKEEVSLRLEKGERAVELKTLGHYQANVDKQEAEAASTLLKALENTPNAVCQIGSILIVKITDGENSRLLSRTLTPHEMVFLERNQNLFKDPTGLFDALSEHCATVEPPTDDGEHPKLIEH